MGSESGIVSSEAPDIRLWTLIAAFSSEFGRGCEPPNFGPWRSDEGDQCLRSGSGLRTDAYHSMYGGFALALLLPEPRVGAITVFESQRQLFEHARDAALAAESRAARTSGPVESRLRRSRSRLRALLATLTGEVKR